MRAPFIGSAKPEATQRPSATQAPTVQLWLGQTGSPGAPQAEQLPLPMHCLPTAQSLLTATQVLAPLVVSQQPAWHMLLAQQREPAVPQATQVLLLHRVLALVQLPPQQGCPAAPQPAHAPFMHAPKFMPHAPPLATHWPAMQQPPAPH